MNFRIYIKKRLLDGNWSETLCIQDSFLGLKESMLIDPKLTKKKNSAGSFEAGVHQDNIAMTTLDPDGRPWIEKGNTRVFIKAFKNKYESPALESADGIVIWDGRVLSCDTDFYNQPKIYAEGALSYLNDTIQPKEVFQYDQKLYHAPWRIFDKIIHNHNLICAGMETVGNAAIDSTMDPTHDLTERVGGHNTYHFGREWPADWVKEQKEEATENASKFSVGEETTMSALTKFLQTFGGSVRITYEWVSSDNRYVRNLEWITEDYDVSKQNDPATISFAVNLLDMTRKTDASSVVTAVMPRGYKAYSGGSWAIGDDMFAPVEELYPRPLDGSRPPGVEPSPRMVSRVTWTSGCYIAKDSFAGAVYKWAESPSGEPSGQIEETMATGFLDAGWPYEEDSQDRRAAGWDDFRFRADHNDPSVYPEYEDADNPEKHANDYGSGAVHTDNGWLRGHALEVTFGETYFISLEQSDGRVTYVVTAGPLGHNGSFVVDINTASSAYWPADERGGTFTKWDHHKVEIKKPTGKFKFGNEYKDYDTELKDKKLYLNISSRGWYYDQGENTDNVYERPWKDWNGSTAGVMGYHRGDNPTVQPDPEGKKTIEQLRIEQRSFGTGPAGIWKGRKIPDGLDEYITLKGLGDGSYSSYFYTITTTTTNQNTGSQVSTSKEIVVDCPSQVGKDTPSGNSIRYPRYDASKPARSYQSAEDLPTDVLNDHNRYPKELIYDATKKLWTWRAIVANQKEQKEYVVVETASGFRRWYEVREFVRSGYFIYDKEAIKRYGRIEKIIDFQDAHNPEYLEEAALQYLYNAKFEEYSLDLTAIDAQLLTEDSDLERILDVMDPVKTHSTFHDISLLLPIEELEIPFNDLGSMSFTLSFSTTQRITSTITAKKR